MLFTKLLKSIVQDGSICIVEPSGNRETVGDGSAPEVTLRVTPKAAGMGLLFNPALKVGEAYMDGHIVVEQGSIYDFLDVVARN